MENDSRTTRYLRTQERERVAEGGQIVLKAVSITRAGLLIYGEEKTVFSAKKRHHSFTVKFIQSNISTIR